MGLRSKLLWRRCADLAIFVAATSFVIGGMTLGVVQPLVAGEYSAYLRAPECATKDALVHRCWSKVDAVVIAHSVARQGLGPLHPTARLHWDGAIPPDFVLQIPQPPAGFYRLRNNQPVKLKIFNGEPTAVFYPGGAMPTNFNPRLTTHVRRTGGVALLGIGLLLLLVHPPLPRWRQREASLLDAAEGRIARGLRASQTRSVLNDRGLLAATGGFVVLQVLDVVSSIVASGGSFEGNALDEALIEAWGPVGGFIGVKLPLIIGVVLAMGRLPRQFAILVAWATSIVMGYYVVHNLLLIWVDTSAR